MSYGTCPCPEVTGTTMAEGQSSQVTCNAVAPVEDNGDGSYTSVCPAGHTHTFDARYLPNVTET